MKDAKTPITRFAKEVFDKKEQELLRAFEKAGNKTPEGQRSQNQIRKELTELQEIINESYVRDFNEKQPAMVQIGCNVVLENMATGDKREYRIMTRNTADPLNGVISNESPIAQRMLGLNLKNTFKFKDNYGKEDSYKITSID